jgi:anti-sigma regulatory factor (Ser/Thr protein kinase)
VTTVVQVPPSLDDRTFEQVLDKVAPLAPDAKVLIDARHTRWASPYGLTALLTLAQSRPERMGFAAPEADDTVSYWARTGFFRHADGLFDLVGHFPKRHSGGESSVLLEITPIVKSDDVHDVVGRIQQKAQQILTGELHLDAKATMPFTMILSEVCQNIVEHAGTGGWVAVQTYNWRKRLGRRVVVISVCDAGKGFRRSLESAPGFLPGSRWGDGTALEQAVIQATSRFRDRGRGQGLAAARKYVTKWEGKLSVRSGTARISIVPAWDDDPPLEEGLAPFSGAQLQVIIPERLSGETAR